MQRLVQVRPVSGRVHDRVRPETRRHPEANGILLDNTLIYYGCSNSATHNNSNYPLLLCGGKNLGLRHGEFHMLNDRKVPLNNLHVSMLKALDAPVDRFSDSTGNLDGVILRG